MLSYWHNIAAAGEDRNGAARVGRRVSAGVFTFLRKSVAIAAVWRSCNRKRSKALRWHLAKRRT